MLIFKDLANHKEVDLGVRTELTTDEVLQNVRWDSDKINHTFS
jgi:hypothetical protein